ncbi:DUF2281 domain-containing protein [Catenovulum maritimum]|uniref:Uncharacterized protein n=1 Tax=Catenovulum maritimum TaxID=1513271 RepID=A0A0J8JJU7_9ALTE|nr:DUF2281 domain-containing protein [Catenovulum maritimum]KMT64721.1 hypothetical protein XM47_12740 [Catenovulum maritimum]
MESLIKEITEHTRNLPDDVQQEVLDFIVFKEQKLAAQKKEASEISLLSESALQDWNNEEEEQAWKSFQ